MIGVLFRLLETGKAFYRPETEGKSKKDLGTEERLFNPDGPDLALFN